MWLLNRRPPPAPPSAKVPAWIVQSAVPVIFAIILGLIAFIGNGFSEDLKGKADNKTVIQFLQNQKDKDDKQWTAIQRLFEQQQKDKDTTRETIDEKLNRLEDKIDAQRVAPKIVNEPKIQQPEKPPLSPREFKEYLELNKEQRAAFRKLHPSYSTLPE